MQEGSMDTIRNATRRLKKKGVSPTVMPFEIQEPYLFQNRWFSQLMKEDLNVQDQYADQDKNPPTAKSIR
jgi:hypothetical protein